MIMRCNLRQGRAIQMKKEEEEARWAAEMEAEAEVARRRMSRAVVGGRPREGGWRRS